LIATSTENKENTTRLWDDSNIESREDSEETIQRLRGINDYVQFYTDIEQ
jgi:hypothetical protein